MAKPKKMTSENLMVIKSNDLIRKKKSALSARQQKIVLYLIAQIEPHDDDFKEYEFKMKDFCHLCGIRCCGKAYQEMWQEIENIADIAIKDVRLPNGWTTMLRWIEKPYYEEKKGIVRIRLDKDMKPFLLELKENFTRYELLNILCMKSKYSIRLYDLICSAHYHELETYTNYLELEELRELLNVPEGTYPEFKSLKAKVLDVAVQEIEEFTDKRVTYTVDRYGRAAVGVEMTISTKPTAERLQTYAKVDALLNGKTFPKEDKKK